MFNQFNPYHQITIIENGGTKTNHSIQYCLPSFTEIVIYTSRTTPQQKLLHGQK